MYRRQNMYIYYTNIEIHILTYNIYNTTLLRDVGSVVLDRGKSETVR